MICIHIFFYKIETKNFFFFYSKILFLLKFAESFFILEFHLFTKFV